MLVFYLGEMAEWLKALVLKVLDEPTNPANTGVPPMFDIGFLFFGGEVDGKKAAIRFAENLMAGSFEQGNSDGRGEN